MFKVLLPIALAYTVYRIGREFVRNVPDIESGPDPSGIYRPQARQPPAGQRRSDGKRRRQPQ